MNEPSRMDEKHVSLLRRHRETFAKSVDVERLLPMLENIISPTEVEEMTQLPSAQARVQRLLDLLPGKGRAAFTYLCLALEPTYPHLLTVMCIGRDRDRDREPTGSSPSTVSPYTSESDIEDRNTRMLMPKPIPIHSHRSLGSVKGTSGQGSLDSDLEDALTRPTSNTLVSPQDRPLAEKVLMDRGTPQGTSQQGLPRELAQGIPQRDYEKLQEKCQHAMVKLEKLTQDNEDILRKCEQARREADYYCKQHRTAMTNGDQLRGELQTLQRLYEELMTERNEVQQDINDLRQRHDCDAKELKELRIQSMMGNPDVKRMYEMAMDRYETLKHEYDNLQKRFGELKGNHSASMNKTDKVQEENNRLQLQIDAVVKERNTLKQQFTSAIRECDKVRREQEDFRQQEFNSRQEVRLLKQAIKKAQSERENSVREYRLVMSERDVVHKEIEKLQDEAQLEATKRKAAEEKLANVKSERAQLHQKLMDTLREHDHAVRRSSELSERCRDMINNTMMAEKERDGILSELHKYEEELRVARHERKEALGQLEEVVQEQYKAKQKQELTNNEYKEVNKELDSLRRKIENLTRENKELVQESENAKRLRDWAFTERDKIVAERESIRVLCDKLRRDRDRAVSNYAEALRKTDDVERKKNEVTKELNQVKQNVKQQEEKEARMQQLIVHHSKDSAIDADSQEWQVETVALETVLDDGDDMTMLGFDIGECNKDLQFPEECSVVITKVDKGSIADGHLRVNDCVVRVNNVDLTNGGDRSVALQAVKNSRGLLNMVVKRRRPSGMRHHAVKLFCGGKEHGLVLDHGVFISRIMPGSAAAKEGSLLPGDRILYVDGYLVENKSVSEVEKMLATNSESVMLSVVRVTGMSLSSSTSPTGESLQSHEMSSSKSSLTMALYNLPVDVQLQKLDRNNLPVDIQHQIPERNSLPAVEIQEQKADRNGNPQGTGGKNLSAQSEKVQKALWDYVQDAKRRESMHSREGSHESASANNSGERTPLALSRENSLREPTTPTSLTSATMTATSMNRIVVGDYPQNSLKRGGDLQHRDSRRGYPGPVVYDGSESQLHHQQVEHVQLPSPTTLSPTSMQVVHYQGYHMREGSRDMNGRSFEQVNEHPRRSLSQDGGRRRSHNSEGNLEGQDLTNGIIRPLQDNSSNDHSYGRDVGMEDLPPQFIRGSRNRESFTVGQSDQRRPKRFEWNDQSRLSFQPHGPNNKSSQANWVECNNGSVHNRSLNVPNYNGNVQQRRPQSHEGYLDAPEPSTHVLQGSFDSAMLRQVHQGHVRSLSSSSGRDIEGERKRDRKHPGNRDDFHTDWVTQKGQSEKLQNGFDEFVEIRTAPTNTRKESSPVKDHSTWPKSHGHPDTWKDGRKKRKREPIPIHGEGSFWTEPDPIVKPTPPSRTSSFKASLRHVTTSGSSSSSDSRRQPSFGKADSKSQKSLNSPQSPTVKVSPISPPNNFQGHTRTDSMKQNGQDLPQQNGFHDDPEPKTKREYVHVGKVEIPSAQTSVFRPVSVPVVSKVKNLASESAIVPRVEHHVHAKMTMGYESHVSQVEPLKLVRAEPVTGWGSGSLSSEPSTPGHYSNTWQGQWGYPMGPAPAQVIVAPNNVPTYQATSYPLPPVNFNRQDEPFFPEEFFPHRAEDMAISHASLPEQRRRHQDSNLSCSSDFPLDSYRMGYMNADSRTGSLPGKGKFNRIRLPGPSSQSDLGSLHSGHSSPTSPSTIDDSPGLSPTGSFEPIVNVIPEGGPNDPRYIEIEKMLEPGLGFCIKEGTKGTNDGIFVNSVTEGSLADRAGLKYGDQILEFNGINLRRATYDLAVTILTRAGNNVSIKAQYNRDKIGDQQRDSMCSSTQSTPIASQTSTRTNSPTPTVTPPTPRANRTQSIISSVSSVMTSDSTQPRFAFLKKTGGSLGIGLYGGNRVGIFVSDIEHTSIAAKPGGLEVGDQILECNGVDLRKATAEQAAIELHKPSDELSLLVQHNLLKYNKIQNHHCDEIFLKALVDYSADKEGHLSFKREEILFVDNTMYNGSLGIWNAWMVDQEGHKTKSGQILSKNSLHREMVHRRQRSESMQEEELRTASSRRTSGPARRSFLKRKKKHQHNNSKDSRELSEGSITDVPVQEDANVPTYLRVECLDLHIKRPVVLLGPLSDKFAQEMEADSCTKYTRGLRRMVQSSHQLLEGDLESGLIIDFQRKDSMFEVINTSTVKDICKRGCHCILYNVNPLVAERLQRLQLHPIVLFIKFKSIKNIKEQKDPHFLREKITNKQAKEMFETAGRIEQEFKSLFTEIINGNTLASISNKVKRTIDNEQRKPIWIPSSQPL